MPSNSNNSKAARVLMEQAPPMFVSMMLIINVLVLIVLKTVLFTRYKIHVLLIISVIGLSYYQNVTINHVEILKHTTIAHLSLHNITYQLKHVNGRVT